MNIGQANKQTNRENSPFVSVVVPTYREADNLPLLIGRIVHTLQPIVPFEIIIVDDDSKDGSTQIVEELAATNSAIKLITRVDERGLSSAVLRGFGQAKGDVLICMDADLSHPPEAIPHLLKALENPQVELALGSRYVPGASLDGKWGFLRLLNSKIATLLARPFTKAKDPLTGFLAIPRQVLQRSNQLEPVGYKIGMELIVKCRCQTIREIPIRFAHRRYGQSKLTFAEQIRYVRHLLRLAYYKAGIFS